MGRKVLIISTVGLIYDGITSVILSYLENMDRSEFDIYIGATMKIEPFFRRRFNELDCNIVTLPHRKEETAKYFRHLYRFIKREKIEVVHAHGNSATLTIEMMAAIIGGAKVRLTHSHNTSCEQKNADRVLRNIFYKTYTRGLACSEVAGEWLYGEHEFTIIPNIRKIGKYKFNMAKRMAYRNKLGLDKEIAIGHVGGFVPQKNHTFLISIFKEILRINPNVRLFLFGGGNERYKIEKLTYDLPVSFMGNVNNIGDYLNAMDGMLLPSKFEGLGLVVIEWQINGLPAIVSNAVPDEAILTDSIRKMSLKTINKYWANDILKMIAANNRREVSEMNQTVFKDSVYNPEKSVKILEDIYKE